MFFVFSVTDKCPYTIKENAPVFVSHQKLCADNIFTDHKYLGKQTFKKMQSMKDLLLYCCGQMPPI